MRIWIPVLLVLLTGVTARADTGEQNEPPIVQKGSPDFLFGRPDGSVTVRGNWVFTRAGSDWYDFVTDQLTLGDKAFNTPGVTFEIGFLLSPHLEVVAGLDFQKAAASSEYRRFVDNNRLPITQQTDLFGTNISGSLKYALVPRGREVGQLAWVPTSVVPYVGAGAGAYWYRLRQYGDFVDYVDLSVFNEVFAADGWTPSAHVFGGADVRLYKRLYLNVEARYLWAAGSLGADWIDFDPIDLAGLRVGTGINVVF